MDAQYLVYPIGSKTEYLKLRDTFAAAALTGIVTVEAHFAPNAHRLVKDVAALAYDYADAMLEARAKQT